MESLPFRFSGVLTPVITPYDDDLRPNSNRLLKHCTWLRSQGVGLAVFGTNSEGNSLSVKEKLLLLDDLVEGGINPLSLMPGTGACSLTDAVELSRHAANLGCGGTLALPPFYYKNVTDDGLYAFFSETIQRVGSDSLRVYLYNIPPVSKIGLSAALIERLISDYPGTIVGIKDSSGQWSNTQALLAESFDDFHVFVGSESFLLQNMRAGGAGCISATANVNPAAIHSLYTGWQNTDADYLQSQLNELRALFSAFPMIPALKAATAYYSGDTAWAHVRPPLVSLSASEVQSLVHQLGDFGFTMPGLNGVDS